MANDTLNGAKLIIDEMEEELTNKRLSRRDRLYLTSNIYMLRLMSTMRGDVQNLKNHDLLSWSMSYPKLATAVIIVLFLLNGMIDWAVLRRPIIAGIIKILTSIDIPLDSLP